VITSLPSPRAVSEVVSGADGVLEGLRPGGTWIDMRTNDPHELERLAALAASCGIATLECPVTGGVHKAAAGEITVIAGGGEAVFAAHRAVLVAMGSSVIHVGPLGQASVIKLVTNMLAFIHLVALGEALMLAKQGGVPLATAFEVIRASSGNSFVHETESQVILNGSYDIGFTLDLAVKDLGLASELGRELGVPLELAALVEATFLRAREQYGGSAWSSQVVKLLEDELGVDLRAPGFPARLEGTPRAPEA
jgi:3-hydroxyisobutyrate dehydrogenase